MAEDTRDDSSTDIIVIPYDVVNSLKRDNEPAALINGNGRFKHKLEELNIAVKAIASLGKNEKWQERTDIAVQTMIPDALAQPIQYIHVETDDKPAVESFSNEDSFNSQKVGQRSLSDRHKAEIVEICSNDPYPPQYVPTCCFCNNRPTLQKQLSIAENATYPFDFNEDIEGIDKQASAQIKCENNTAAKDNVDVGVESENSFPYLKSNSTFFPFQNQNQTKTVYSNALMKYDSQPQCCYSYLNNALNYLTEKREKKFPSFCATSACQSTHSSHQNKNPAENMTANSPCCYLNSWTCPCCGRKMSNGDVNAACCQNNANGSKDDCCGACSNFNYGDGTANCNGNTEGVTYNNCCCYPNGADYDGGYAGNSETACCYGGCYGGEACNGAYSGPASGCCAAANNATSGMSQFMPTNSCLSNASNRKFSGSACTGNMDIGNAGIDNAFAANTCVSNAGVSFPDGVVSGTSVGNTGVCGATNGAASCCPLGSAASGGNQNNCNNCCNYFYPSCCQSCTMNYTSAGNYPEQADQNCSNQNYVVHEVPKKMIIKEIEFDPSRNIARSLGGENVNKVGFFGQIRGTLEDYNSKCTCNNCQCHRQTESSQEFHDRMAGGGSAAQICCPSSNDLMAQDNSSSCRVYSTTYSEDFSKNANNDFLRSDSSILN